VTAAVETRALTRRFGALVAVDHLDLTISGGEVYGLLGRNGAGKTTAIRMLLGLIRPDEGTARLLGRHVDSRGGPDGPWAGVGYLLERPGLYPDLTVRDHLAIVARYRRLDRAAIADTVDRLALGAFLDVRARALSLGNRQRLGLALALVHRPRLLVLDEPGNGLDPAGVVEVRALVREQADDGVAVLMSSHLLAEVARVTDRVGLIRSGHLVEELDPADLSALGRARLRAVLPPSSDVRAAVAALTAAGLTATADGDLLTCTDDVSVAHPERVATVLVRAGVAPRELAVVADDLEAHFLRVTGEGA
jgi:ABC-2 type transport system ATP-binding protein